MSRPRSLGYFNKHVRKSARREKIDAVFADDYDTIAPVFLSFLERLSSADFTCRSLDRFGLEPAEGPAFYFRYDVHIHDMPATFALARLHEEHRVPGVFYVNWLFSEAEERFADYFKLLLHYDQEWVQFGLHCAPTATWLINHRFGKDGKLARQHILAEEFADELLANARSQAESADEPPELARLFQGGSEELERVHRSFEQNFGRWRTVTGHGNFVSRSYLRALRSHPEIKGLMPYYNAVDFLNAYGVEKLGYAFEATRNPEANDQVCRMVFDGHPNLSSRVAEFLGDRQSFAVTFHPSRWLDCAFSSSLLARPDAA